MTNNTAFETWATLNRTKQAKIIGLAGVIDHLRLPPTDPMLKNVVRFEPRQLPNHAAGKSAEAFADCIGRPLLAILQTGNHVVALTAIENRGLEMHKLGDDGTHLSVETITDDQPHLVGGGSVMTETWARVQRRGLAWEIAAVGLDGLGIAVHAHTNYQQYGNPALLAMAAAGDLPKLGPA